MKTIEQTVTVGIYENCTNAIRIYKDRAVVTTNYVKWENNTGTLAKRRTRLTGSDFATVIDLLAGKKAMVDFGGDKMTGEKAVWFFVQDRV